MPATHVTHCDLHFRHLLIEGEALARVIDWGDLARADPGVDLMTYWLALPAFARPDFLRGLRRRARESAAARRVWAFYVAAVLLAYGLDQGLDAVAREALGSLRRVATG